MRQGSRSCTIGIWCVVAVGAFLLAVCSSETPSTEGPAAEAPEQTDGGEVGEEAEAAPPAVSAAMTPLFGGIVQALGDYVVELLARPDGNLEAQVRNYMGQPVITVPVAAATPAPPAAAAAPTPAEATLPEDVSISAEVEGEDGEVVPVVLLPSEDRFIGTVTGVSGVHPVKIALNQVEQLEPVAEAVFTDLEIASVPEPIEPQHNGRVTLLGDARFEVAMDSRGNVYVSVSDRDGSPIPPDLVHLQQIRIIGPEGPRVVALRPRGAMFVGSYGGPPPPLFTAVFDIGFGDRHYRHVRLRRLRPAPPAIAVRVPPRFAKQGAWRRDWRWGWSVRPTPVVRRPPRPGRRVRPGVPPPPSAGIRPGAPPPPPAAGIRPGVPPAPPVGVRPGAPPPPGVKVRPGVPPPPAAGVRPGAPPPHPTKVGPGAPPPTKAGPGAPPHPGRGPHGKTPPPPPGKGHAKGHQPSKGPPPHGKGHAKGHRPDEAPPPPRGKGHAKGHGPGKAPPPPGTKGH